MLPEPKIRSLSPKKLVGISTTMSLVHNTTGELWRNFMMRRSQIENKVDKYLYSLQNYSPSYFERFSPTNTFEKWAAVEVNNFDQIPDGMSGLELTGGLYAVFLYQGASSEGAKVFHYIFNVWLPQSGYLLDNRLHFELLGEKFKNNDPSSEEEFWIPVRAK